MYTHPGLLLAFSQGFSQDLLSSHYPFFSLPHDQLLPINNPNLSEFLQGSIVQSSAVLEYDLGGEGDLFKAPEPIIGESVLALDPIASGMPLISDVDDVITAETIQIADVESIQIEHLDDIINECKKVFLGKSLTEETIPEHEVAQQIDEEDSEKAKSRIIAEGQTQKSVSSGSLKSMEWINACCNRRPNFLNYQGLDFEAAFGMRRPISEEALQPEFLQGSIVQSSAVLEYDLGGEGDLFKAPEPIIGESVLALDPIA
ncbi:hypothetical protein IHE45_04G069000, partial [Dioscorea alata]